MSWLQRSLSSVASVASGDGPSTAAAARGVKDDLSELSDSFSRSLRGVASFLAPAPMSISTPDPPVGRGEEEREEEEEEGWEVEAVGVTEEVMAFVNDIARHPETWLDFPLLPDDYEDGSADDGEANPSADEPFSYFDMSHAQEEHALAIEQLAPRLSALRIELCPIHMSEECFWKIYFVLLHPRLNKQDAQLLSTPQVVEARALLLQELQNRAKSEARNRLLDPRPEGLKGPSSDMLRGGTWEEEEGEVEADDVEVEKHVIKETLPQQPQKTPNEASAAMIAAMESSDKDTDDWFHREASAANISIDIGAVDDVDEVSFSDLEEEEEEDSRK